MIKLKSLYNEMKLIPKNSIIGELNNVYQKLRNLLGKEQYIKIIYNIKDKDINLIIPGWSRLREYKIDKINEIIEEFQNKMNILIQLCGGYSQDKGLDEPIQID